MKADRPRVVVVDDGEIYASLVAERMPELELVRPGVEGGEERLPDGPAALEWLERNPAAADVVLLDINFGVPEDRLLPLDPPASLRRTRRFQGVAILSEIRRRFPHLPVVLLTAVEDLSLVDVSGSLAAQSMTYFLDSLDLDALRIRIHAAVEESELSLEEAGVLWGADPAMRALRRRLAVLSRGRMPVVIEGETGTGKSFLAERFVHPNTGRPGPFVVLDLATVPPDLVPATLFGAMRGAYTGAVADRKGVFQLAHRGTLFIDEVQSIPPAVQRQLLLVLQDRRVRPLGASRDVDVDVKIVAASNAPLLEAVRAGSFRSDLYMRLNPATRVRIPPLRERRADLAFLARSFASRAMDDRDLGGLRDRITRSLGLGAGTPAELIVGRSGGRGRGSQAHPVLEIQIPEPAWKMLLGHPWPGNTRELQMVMHNLLAFTLVGAADALQSGLPLDAPRLQIDPGLLGGLLAGTLAVDVPDRRATEGAEAESDPEGVGVRIRPGATLHAVSNDVERQYMLALFRRHAGDFASMAEVLLGDRNRARAVRLRFNQIGLRVRELR